jgi:hypothetical protein
VASCSYSFGKFVAFSKLNFPTTLVGLAPWHGNAW